MLHCNIRSAVTSPTAIGTVLRFIRMTPDFDDLDLSALDATDADHPGQGPAGEGHSGSADRHKRAAYEVAAIETDPWPLLIGHVRFVLGWIILPQPITAQAGRR